MVSLALLCSSAALAASEKDLASPKIDRSGVIAKEMDSSGLARVIVTVATAASPDAMQQQLASDEGRSAAMAAIAEATKTVAMRHFGPAQVVNGFAISKFSTSPGFSATVTKAQLDALTKDPAVVSIRPDMAATTQLDTSTVAIGMPGAWAGAATGSNRTVAVIDTGVQANHPFIGAARVVLEGCFLISAACPNATNEQKGAGASYPGNNNIPHGTHVSGIALGKNTAPAGSPAAGVAKSAKLFAMNVFESTGYTYDSSMIRALEYVEDRVINQPTLRITSVNMSIGGGAYGDYCDGLSPQMKAVIDRLRLKRVAVVVAAGNSGYGALMSFPGCLSNVVSVGATNRAGNAIAYYSNIDRLTRLLAPGGDANNGGVVVSSILNSAYGGMQGTSMAAPHVAGAFAALMTKFPTTQISVIEDALRRSGVNVVDTRGGGIAKPRIQVDAAMNLLTAATPPANDAFASATVIPSVMGWDQWGSTGNGTRETSEPTHGAGPSSWWRWTAPFTKTTKISTLGSNFDTVLAVYTGSSVGALTRVAYNDNADPTTNASSVTFNAVAGVTYNIAVGGRAASSAGAVHLTATPVPENDSFARARSVAISKTAMTLITGNNFGATTEAGEPVQNGINTVWWKFTAPVSGQYTMDTVGSMTMTGNALDTKMAVYTGTTLATLTTVAADDDSGFGNYSQVTFNAVAGTTYYLAVGAYDYSNLEMPDESGNLRINVAPPGFIYQRPAVPGGMAAAALKR